MCIDNPPHEKNWRLYHLLDILQPTTTKQVKWNFRKVTLRHHYYQAYLVLYNRSRKYLYDTVGEDAYGFLSSGSWGPFVPLLGAAGSIIFYCVLMMVQIALLIIFFAFLGARVDNVIDWSYEKVVIPLMIFACLMLLTCIAAVAINFASPRTYREGLAVIDRLSPIGNLLAAICYFCLPFVIGAEINLDPGLKIGKYMTYLCLPIMGDIFYYLTSLIWRWPRRLRMQMEVGNNRPSPVIYNGIFAMGFANMLCGIAQWVLIGLKLDDKLERSWYYVFIPFCARCGIRIAEACLRSLMKYTVGVRSKIGVAFDTVGAFFANGMLLVSLYFVAVRIERGMQKVRMARALIPVYIVLAYIFLCLIVTMIILLIYYSRAADEEKQINANWVPPSDKDEEEDNATPKTLGSTEPTDNAPLPYADDLNRGWDEVDDITPSSAAFPPEDVEPYDDYNTDAEDDEPRLVKETPRSSQQPYGTPRDDEEFSEVTPRSLQNDEEEPPTYEESRKVTTKTRRVYLDPSEGGSQLQPETPASHQPVSERSMTDVDSYEYTEVTTYLDEESPRTEEDGPVPSGSSSTYTDETNYLDDDGTRSYTYDSGYETYYYSYSASPSGSFTSATADSADLTR